MFNFIRNFFNRTNEGVLEIRTTEGPQFEIVRAGNRYAVLNRRTGGLYRTYSRKRDAVRGINRLTATYA